MPNVLLPYRKPPRTPPGCQDHLTRQQAAALLGFSSEYKIRQLEREGRLQSVRGPMRTAFYARADILALKAELVRESFDQDRPDGWTDAELLLLLGHPNSEGRARSALDLVLETHISIDRAERVCAFWATAQAAAQRTSPALQAPAPQPAVGVSLPRECAATPSQAAAPVASTATGASAEPASRGPDERRSKGRLSRDALISQLRDPDPRARERAFARLKAIDAGEVRSAPRR